MASLFRPTIIRFIDRAGKQVPKGTPGAKRVREKSQTWRAKYVDAKGKAKTVSLFDDKQASQARLAEILHQVREEHAGVVRPVDPFELHRARPLTEHIADWEKTLRSRERAEKHVFKLISYLTRIATACEWTTLANVSADVWNTTCMSDVFRGCRSQPQTITLPLPRTSETGLSGLAQNVLLRIHLADLAS